MKKLLAVLFSILLPAAVFAQGSIPITFGVNMKVQAFEGNFNAAEDKIFVRGNFQKAGNN